LIPTLVLVDRTCLGVKNALVTDSVSQIALERWIERRADMLGDLEPCELLVGQSVIYHAIDYARSLGFEPHRDFPEPIVGPRPLELLDTPYAHPSRPYYISGPSDDVAAIVAQLDSAVGRGNYDFFVPAEVFPD